MSLEQKERNVKRDTSRMVEKDASQGRQDDGNLSEERRVDDTRKEAMLGIGREEHDY